MQVYINLHGVIKVHADGALQGFYQSILKDHCNFQRFKISCTDMHYSLNYFHFKDFNKHAWIIMYVITERIHGVDRMRKTFLLSSCLCKYCYSGHYYGAEINHCITTTCGMILTF